MDEQAKREFVLDLEEAIEATANSLIRASIVVEHAKRAVMRYGEAEAVLGLCWNVWDAQAIGERLEARQAHRSLGFVIGCLVRDHASCLREMGS